MKTVRTRAPQRPPWQRFAAYARAAGWSPREPCMWSSTPQRVLFPIDNVRLGSAEEIDELPRRRSSYIATIPWSAMRCCGGGCTMNYNTICAQRIAGALGAEIAGVDLSPPLSDEVIGEIRQALLDHQVIFFHDQHLTPEQHLAFGRRFGELQIHDFVEPARRISTSSRSARSLTRRAISAAAGTPMSVISNGHRSARCFTHAKFQPSVVTQCSPANTWLMRRCPTA